LIVGLEALKKNRFCFHRIKAQKEIDRNINNLKRPIFPSYLSNNFNAVD
jgi:hypothetical protein